MVFAPKINDAVVDVAFTAARSRLFCGYFSVSSASGEGEKGARSIGIRDRGERCKLEVRGRGRGERTP